jgi:hypothetical protein
MEKFVIPIGVKKSLLLFQKSSLGRLRRLEKSIEKKILKGEMKEEEAQNVVINFINKNKVKEQQVFVRWLTMVFPNEEKKENHTVRSFNEEHSQNA